MTETLSRRPYMIDASSMQTAVRAVAYAGIVASLVPGGALVCFYIVAAFGFVAWLRGAELDAEIRRAGLILGGWYAALLVIDLINDGSPVELVRPATNYFVLLAFPSFVVGLRSLHLDMRVVDRMAIAVVLVAACWTVYQTEFVATSQVEGLQLGPAIFGMAVLTWAILLFSRALAADPFDWVRGGVAAVGLVPILLSGSRIDWACSILAIVVVVALWARSGRRWRSVAIAAVGLLVVALIAYQSPLARNRVNTFVSDIHAFSTSGNTKGPSFGLRYEMTVSGFRAFLDHPWLGYGLSHVKEAALAHRQASFSDFSFLSHLHNDYVTHLVAFGFLGAVFIVSIFVLIFWTAWSSADAGLRRFGIAMSLAFPLFMTVEIVFNQDPMYGLLFFIFGLLFQSIRPVEERSPVASTRA